MKLFSRIWKYILPQISKHKLAFFTIVFLFAVRIVLDMIIAPIYFKKIVDTISTPGVVPSLVSPDLFHSVYVIIGIYLLVTLTARSRQFLYFDFLVKTIRSLRDYAFQKIEINSYTFFSNTFAGSLVTKSRRFVTAYESMMDIFIFGFLQIFVIMVGVFIVLFNVSAPVASVFLGLTVLYIFIISLFLRKKMKYDILEAEQDSRISGRLADVFSNILAVKFFSARESEIRSFGEYTEEGARRTRKAWGWHGRIEIVQSVFSTLIQSVVLYITINLWINEEISTGTVVLVQTYVGIILLRLWDLSSSLTKFMKAISDMKEVVDIFEIESDIKDPEHPEKLRIKDGHILFKDVSFNYVPEVEVLDGFNLDIRPGERVGVVGHSGAGKSTITKLILRFNDVSSGAILIDGQDIRNILQSDLRRMISYVPQEPILFHRPIRENISYGKFDATQAEIEEVARKAHAHEFISKLPQGYDTLVGERGVKLSGGERQRVAIARAMLKDSPILVLDEATSSLDSVSESYIQDSLGELMKGKTTIVIAHRLSTIQKMDRIIVLDKGRIVEEGTHEKLLAEDGIYKDLWDHQTGGFLE